MTIQSTLQQHFVLNTFNLQEKVKSNTLMWTCTHLKSISSHSVSHYLHLKFASSSSFHVISLSVSHSLRKTSCNSAVEYTLDSCCNYKEKYGRIDTPGGGRESGIKKKQEHLWKIRRVGKCGVWFLESEGVKNIIVHFLSLRPFGLSIWRVAP